MILMVQHQVQDFDSWKLVFDEHVSVRAQHGAKRHWLHRGLDDPNDVLIAVEFPTREAAEGLLADPSLPEAMERAGVVGEPVVKLYDDGEGADY